MAKKSPAARKARKPTPRPEPAPEPEAVEPEPAPAAPEPAPGPEPDGVAVRLAADRVVADCPLGVGCLLCVVHSLGLEVRRLFDMVANGFARVEEIDAEKAPDLFSVVQVKDHGTEAQAGAVLGTLEMRPGVPPNFVVDGVAKELNRVVRVEPLASRDPDE